MDLLVDIISQLQELSKLKPVDLRLGIQTLIESVKKLQRRRKKSKKKILDLGAILEEKIINEIEKDQLLLITKINQKIREEL